MKKNLLTVTILALVLSLMPLSCVWAASNGSDAHSPSMSVGSGEDPVPGVEVEEIVTDSELGETDETEAVEAAPEEQIEQPIQDVEEAKDLAKGSLLNGMKKMLAENPVIWIAGIAVVGAGSVVAEILATKRRQKKNGSDKHYKGKH